MYWVQTIQTTSNIYIQSVSEKSEFKFFRLQNQKCRRNEKGFSIKYFALKPIWQDINLKIFLLG